ncbi:hypothetical protein Vretimale_10993 [Volvox reticuliferus]|nr:hypothetical protein Vretifemale_12726 [Volvox reticuliferus]GIM06740.1 hypothetical protein Vretimale_10993 [Volvox reticuliferus]
MEDVDDGMQPLELDSHPQQHPECSLRVISAGDDGACTGAASQAAAKEEAAPDLAGVAQGEAAAGEADVRSTSVAAGPSGSSDHKHAYGHGHGHHAHFQPSLVLEDVAGEPEGRSGFSSDSERRISLTGGSDGESTGEEARRKFEQRRKAHYNMRAALRRARMLLSEDEDDGERDSDGEDGPSRTATCSVDAAADADVTMSDGGKQAGGDPAAS